MIEETLFKQTYPRRKFNLLVWVQIESLEGELLPVLLGSPPPWDGSPEGWDRGGWLAHDTLEFGFSAILADHSLRLNGQVDWLQWALQQGIMPYQPFLLRLGTPRWVPGPWECPEDGEYVYDVQVFLPGLDPAMARKAWDEFLNESEARFYELLTTE